MAKLIQIDVSDGKQVQAWGKSLARTEAFPLDANSLHANYSSLVTYATTSSKAYVGQIVVNLEDATVYVIKNEAGDLLKINAPEGALVFKGTAIGEPQKVYVDEEGNIYLTQPAEGITTTEKQGLPLKKNNDTNTVTEWAIADDTTNGYIYFSSDGKEYVSNGSSWDRLELNIDTSTLATQAALSVVEGKVNKNTESIGNLTNLINSNTGKIDTLEDHVGTDGSSVDDEWQTNVENPDEGQPSTRTLTLTERVNKLKSKFASYYTAAEIDAKLAALPSGGGAIWEDISTNATN